jgi:hypothetical protein
MSATNLSAMWSVATRYGSQRLSERGFIPKLIE